ncbi:hypothetical protein HCH_01012 [Hahella chejuensis KCTC 2396]|uniref:Uncharacterized protein n=1 Tax=Hahella chejuensis (strain KCTC 2396) TaxID=349521 RepID=Q2SN77_HAHCH|nr:hypothetical protein HCH_01012 [Hahella chejuensis KCTC 2396]
MLVVIVRTSAAIIASWASCPVVLIFVFLRLHQWLYF